MRSTWQAGGIEKARVVHRLPFKVWKACVGVVTAAFPTIFGGGDQYHRPPQRTLRIQRLQLGAHGLNQGSWKRLKCHVSIIQAWISYGFRMVFL